VISDVGVAFEDPGVLRVSWRADRRATTVRVGLGSSPDPHTHAPVLEVASENGRARLEGVPSGRQYVSLTVDDAVVVAAERRVEFEGPANFRDLGGYPSRLGGHTQWGVLFRSDSLHECTAEDLDRLDRLGVRTIFDLRSDEEREMAPGPRPHVVLTVSGGRLATLDPENLPDRESGERWLFDDYCAMLEVAGPAFGRLLTELANPGVYPAIVHCMGGKDRAGMSAALLLTWLDVDRETVLDDYELSSAYALADRLEPLVASLTARGIDESAARGLFGAPRWAMAGALDLLDTRYGGVGPYLRGPGGMGEAALAALRTNLLA